VGKTKKEAGAALKKGMRNTYPTREGRTFGGTISLPKKALKKGDYGMRKM